MALFSHLFDAFWRRVDSFTGRLSVLFDLDEHTGGFAGAHHYSDAPGAPRVDGVFIACPGIDRIVVGARGFLRAKLAAHGVAAHLDGWPAYRVSNDDAMVRALAEAAAAELGHALPLAVVGPSNIGNDLARKGIPALCGFGVRAENLHAADERMEMATAGPVLSGLRTGAAAAARRVTG